MKTLALGLVIGTLIGGIAGIAAPKKQQYSTSLSVEMGEIARYAEPNSVHSWVHCDICKQGVIRKENGACSFCGKAPYEKH